MNIILALIGALYVIAAIVAINQARLAIVVDKALLEVSGQPEKDRWVAWVILAMALLYGVAGRLLVAGSAWAVLLLGKGLILQAIYHFGLRKLLPVAETTLSDKILRVSRARNAAVISTAVFAASAYGWRTGALT